MFTIRPRFNNHINTFDDMFPGDSFFRSFFDMSDAVGNAGFRVDVRDENDKFVIEAELPGVKEDNISLSYNDNVLTIAADVKSNKDEKKDNYVYCERKVGHMERRFNIESIKQDEIVANFENGVLMINLPKQNIEKPQPRKIEINTNHAKIEAPNPDN